MLLKLFKEKADAMLQPKQCLSIIALPGGRAVFNKAVQQFAVCVCACVCVGEF